MGKFFSYKMSIQKNSKNPVQQTVTSTMKEDSYRFDIESKDKDPMSLILEEIWILEGIKCRAGYYNMSDELVDAIYHCAKIEHTKVTRKKFSDERVQFGGATPFLVNFAIMF